MSSELKEACGVFGILAPEEDVARLSYFALYALQHRGQESAGIGVASGKDVSVYKEMGLVHQVFDERVLSILKGKGAIGHTRYSTTGSSCYENAQPVLVKREGLFHQTLALAHNGNLINSRELRRRLEDRGVSLAGTSDTELMVKTIALKEGPLLEACREVIPKFKGAYSIVMLSADHVFAIRDPYGIRPLVLGKLNGAYVFASETCALDIIGAKHLEDLEAGVLYCLGREGISRYPIMSQEKPSFCIFELIYFARPDSCVAGESVHRIRHKLGELLAEEQPADADVVISVPDSSTPAAIGYSHGSGIPYAEGLIKNRYVHRTFIQPDKRIREIGVRMKLNPLVATIRGKRVVMVDDSIVRGTTSRKIVQLLRESGAKEVHVRVSSPPIRYPCYYGIDMATTGELIAHAKDASAVGEIIGADSIGYLSYVAMIKATGMSADHFCTACFNDEYPIKVPKQLSLSKLMFEGMPVIPRR